MTTFFNALRLSIHAPVDRRNLLHPLASIQMFHGQYFRLRPMKMIGKKGYLLVQVREGVANDPPTAAISSG